MHEKELAATLRRIAESGEPQMVFVGPSGVYLVPTDAELVGSYSARSTAADLREDLAALGEHRPADPPPPWREASDE